MPFEWTGEEEESPFTAPFLDMTSLTPLTLTLTLTENIWGV